LLLDGLFFTIFSSVMVFHSLQDGHLPTHLAVCAPHEVQK
jgi:hypothetical protein